MRSSGVGYSPMQCRSAKSLPRWARKLATRSMSSRFAPAVEAITGLSLRTTRSSWGQSVKEQLAILMMSRPWPSITSTEGSSKGVAMARKPLLRISATRRSNSARPRRVSEKRLTYLMSSRPRAAGWMKLSRSRYCNLNAKRKGNARQTSPKARTTAMPWSTSPMWLLAISRMNRGVGIMLSVIGFP